MQVSGLHVLLREASFLQYCSVWMDIAQGIWFAAVAFCCIKCGIRLTLVAKRLASS